MGNTSLSITSFYHMYIDCRYYMFVEYNAKNFSFLILYDRFVSYNGNKYVCPIVSTSATDKINIVIRACV